MDRMKWLKRVNVILFILLAYQGITGLMADVLKEVFEVIHPVGGVLLVIVALIHIGLNWNWVRSVYLKKKP